MKAFIILGLTLFLGYSDLWVGNYVSFFQGTDQLGTIANFEAPCTVTHKNSLCTAKYIIPKSLINGHEAIGFGKVISATKTYCLNKETGTVVIDDIFNPGKRFDLMNLYQTVNLNNLNCNNDLVIEAYSQKSAIRKGYQAGPLILGTAEQVRTVKSLSEFYSKDIHRIFCFLFILLFLSFTIFNSILSTSNKTNIFTNTLSYWLFFVFFATDIFQTLIPYNHAPLLTNKLVAIFSILAHATPILLYLSKPLEKLYKTQKIKFHSIALTLTAAFIFSNFWLYFFHTIFLVTAGSSLIASLKRKNLTLAAYGIIVLLVDLKIQNVSGMPSAMSTSVFLGLLVTTELLTELRSTTKVFKLLVNIKTFSKHKGRESTTGEIEVSLLKAIPADRVSFLQLSENHSCKITVYQKQGQKTTTEKIDISYLPPIFAHAIASDTPLIHQPSDSDLIKNIKLKDESLRSYCGDFLTVLPLKLGEEVLGAIAFTDYSRNLVKDKNKNEEINLYLDMLTPIYCEQIKREHLLQSNHSGERLKTLGTEISNIVESRYSNDEEFYGEVLKTINSQYQSWGYLGQFNPKTDRVEIKSCLGYPEDITKRIRNGIVLASKDNKHGPIPLAIHGERPIAVSNTDLLSGVLHEFTKYFFKRTSTKSCLAIPIMDSTDRKTPWGVLFIESKDLQAFSPKDKREHSEIGNILHKAISRKRALHDSKLTKEALKEFVPRERLSDVIQKKNLEQFSEGFLLMIDLKGSTNLCNSFGRETWEKTSNTIKDEIQSISKLYNMTLSEFKWDAFYLSLETDQTNNHSLHSIYSFLSETVDIINRNYQLNYPRVHEFKNNNSPKARFCMVYGDVSMGIVEGQTKVWTFKGQERANITKLEEDCKRIQKENPFTVLFADSSLPDIKNLANEWNATGEIVNSSQREIYSSPFSWSDLKRFNSETKKKTA